MRPDRGFRASEAERIAVRLPLVEGDDDFGVPAGWYPDPLGLPQLRWWDGQSWTEFTSEAQAPVMMQPAPVQEPVLATASAAPVETPVAASAPAFSDPLASADAAAIAAAAAALVDASSRTEAAAPVARAPSIPAEPIPQAVAEPVVNHRNLGGEMQFLTRRERREYERRLEAEAAMFPSASGGPASPAAYIQQPVVPEATGTTMPASDEPAFAFPSVAEPIVPEPLQPQPMAQEPYRPEPMFDQPRPEEPVAPVSFADLIAGEQPVASSSGALAIPTDPPPFVASGLRELEPALSEILAEAALAPMPAAAVPAAAIPSGFQVDEIVVEAEPAPESRVLAKRTYTAASWVLAAFSVIQVALAYLVVIVMDQPANRPVAAVIWFGGLLVAAGIAGYDRLQLKASGHERAAAGWWALLTPLAYLLARWTRTRVETGRGLLLVLVWVLGTVLACGLVYLQPILFLAAIQ